MVNNTSKTHVRSVKRVREDFKKRGVYYTDEALARWRRDAGAAAYTAR